MAAEQSVTNGAHHVPTIHELGDVLRERREAMGASLAEVEAATRIRQKYLAAIESDDWHLLPGEIVGRGFLRNYATYLGLDPTELVERRRAVADPSLASSLANTSAGSTLPPERTVDYRPKDVALKDEQEAIQQRELRIGPAVRRLFGLLGVLLVLWVVVSNFGAQITTGLTNTVAGVQTTVANVRTAPTAESTPFAVADNPARPTQGIVPENPGGAALAPTPAAAANPTVGSEAPGGVDMSPTTAVVPTVASTPKVRTLVLIPTNTPAADAVAPTPTNTVEPTPTQVPPTDTPAPVPTDTPEPPPTAVAAAVAPACPDARSVILTPGVKQVISGPVAVTGQAIHEGFQYYKLEYALGADASDGYIYFDGANSAVDGGTLGILNTGSLPNGEYTLRLTVVDQSANYPPPCQVTVVIQN